MPYVSMPGLGRGLSHGGSGEQLDLSPVGSDDDEAESEVTAINPMGLPLKELKKLKDKFHDERGQMIKLTSDQFVQALSTNRRDDRTAAELHTLFKKIDASCTDSVDWEEFTNYMLLHMPGFGGGNGRCELSHTVQGSDALAGAWNSGHTDMINSISVVYDIGASSGTGPGRRYVTAGRDGFVRVWHPNLTLHRAIDVGQHRSWLSSCCWMSKSRRLAVASSSFRIYFYDTAFNPTPNSHIDHKEGTPLCLGYLDSHESDGREKEILMVGDNNGFVTVYQMDENWTEQVSLSESDGLKFKMKPTRRQYHTDWVTKVGYVSDVNYMVTCGLDGEINLCDVHMNQRKEGRDVLRLHKKGVHTWCWCRSQKFFASAGLDRQIIIWNPFSGKATNYLQGHSAPVIEVLVNEGQHQLISMSLDKVVKVWDIRNCKCVQTFTDKTEYKPEDRLTCMAFDEEGPALVLCSSSLNVLPVSVKVETSRTHSAPIVTALYNGVFKQVVSGDQQGTICVWDVRTGKLEFEFKRVHQDAKLTCMAFDVEQRRIYTGAEDGLVKLWNFSSGQQLRTYTMKSPSEITGLLWAREGPNTFVVALAWDRRIYVWPDSRKQTVEAQYVLEDSSGQGHTDDISCICRLSPINGLLATGGDDGHVIFWKIQESSSGMRYRLSDKSSSTTKEGEAEAKTGGMEVKAPRRRRPGARTERSVASESDAPQPTTASGPGKPSVARGGSTYAREILARKQGSQEAVGGETPRGAEVWWPEELGFDDSHMSIGPPGVERMVFLEHKDVILSTHTDRLMRAWSTKMPEFLQRIELSPEKKPEASQTDFCTSVASNASIAAQLPPGITALYAERVENSWLFTGDAEGCIRTWDLSPIRAGGPIPRCLARVGEFQPHRQAVTQLEHFELDDRSVIVSAAADWTIALSTFEGTRIGTFSSRGPHWHLADSSTWCNLVLPQDEGPRASEEDGWSLSPRRPGRGCGLARTPAGNMSGTAGSSSSRTRPATHNVTTQGHCGQGVFKKLSAVERFKPDLVLVEQERQRLARQPPRHDQ